MSNSTHGLIKIACRDIDSQAPLTEPQEPVGVPRETKDLRGVTRLANLGGSHVLALQSGDGGRKHLRSLKTASCRRPRHRARSRAAGRRGQCVVVALRRSGLPAARGPAPRRPRAGAAP